MSERAEAAPEIIDAEVQPVEPPPKRRAPAAALAAIVAALVAAVVAAGMLWLLGQRPTPTADAQLAERVAALERALAARPPPVPGVEAREAIAGLRQQLEELARDLAGRPDPSERLMRLEERLKASEERGEGPGLAALAMRVAGLEQRLLERREPDTALLRRLDGLAQRIDGIERTMAALTDAHAEQAAAIKRDLSRITALARLRAAALRGAPYREALADVERQAVGLPESALAPLRARAAAGVPALAELRARFEGVAPEILRASRIAAGGSWWEQTLARLTTLVTIRRVGEVPGEDAEAIIARAEARLGRGDLAAAVVEIDRLTGAAAEAARGWRAAAGERLAVERAIAELEGATIAGLAEGR
jgi:hypothetical protein